ncbi:MAG: CotH kinase family protein [Candidatus Spyradocola sp.]
MKSGIRAGCRRLLPGLLLCLTLSGCTVQTMETPSEWILTQQETYEKAEAVEFQVTDSAKLYSREVPERIDTVYLAVAPGNAADGTDYTWTQINAVALEDQGEQPYQCEGVFQLGDEDAPTEGSFGYGQLTANCVVRLQGANASKRQQKSYRITIKDGMGSLDGMKSLVLSKSFTDPLRVTNMLCYRLMEGIPSLLSTRTRLVHLYVKDTADGADALYRDYGLYTMVEPINKSYFKERNLDNDGAIYKANDFDFARHEDVLKLSTARDYDAAAFEAILEVKGDQNHERLLNMLDAVNDPDIPIRQVIETYFDEDNLFGWLAFNLLTGNKDVATQNFYLYSPTGSERFYFISWDCDGAFRDAYEEMRAPGQSPEWENGVFTLYDNVLFRRLLQDPHCVSELSSAVDTLYENYLTEEAVSAQAELLTDLARDAVYSLPDRTFARVTQQQYDELASQVGQQVTENFYKYYESLEKPAPFHIHEPQLTEEGLLLSWDEAVCDKEVTYTVVLDNSWDFGMPLRRDERTETSWVIGELPVGQYFLKVTANTADGQSQIAYESYSTELKTTLYGVLCFYVLPDGSVHASYFDRGD